MIKGSSLPLTILFQAAVVEIETFQEFANWNQQEKRACLADIFIELHQICAEENYTLETPDRIDRPHPFSGTTPFPKNFAEFQNVIKK